MTHPRGACSFFSSGIVILLTRLLRGGEDAFWSDIWTYCNCWVIAEWWGRLSSSLLLLAEENINIPFLGIGFHKICTVFNDGPKHSQYHLSLGYREGVTNLPFYSSAKA